jgi:HEAT repeat protein
MEGTWGGSSDVAVELRTICVAALVNMRSRRSMEMIVRLLADGDPSARAAAIRSLAAHGGRCGEALARYKLLVGDREPNVVAECFPAAIALTRSLEPVEPFLDSDDEGLREAAILAVGESRLPAAFELLRARWDGSSIRTYGSCLRRRSA